MSEIFEEVLGPTAKLETSPPILVDFCEQQPPPESPHSRDPNSLKPFSLPSPLLDLLAARACCSLWCKSHPSLLGSSVTELLPFTGKVSASSNFMCCLLFQSLVKSKKLRGRSKIQPQRSSRVSRPCGTHAHSCRHSLEGNLAFNDLALYL